MTFLINANSEATRRRGDVVGSHLLLAFRLSRSHAYSACMFDTNDGTWSSKAKHLVFVFVLRICNERHTRNYIYLYTLSSLMLVKNSGGLYTGSTMTGRSPERERKLVHAALHDATVRFQAIVTRRVFHQDLSVIAFLIESLVHTLYVLLICSILV